MPQHADNQGAMVDVGDGGGRRPDQEGCAGGGCGGPGAVSADEFATSAGELGVVRVVEREPMQPQHPFIEAESDPRKRVGKLPGQACLS